MRCLLVLFLSACASSTATWTNYEMDESVRPGFLGALRDAKGEARLVAGDRCYVIHDTAVQVEIRKLTAAIADSIAEHGSEEPQGDCIDEDAAPVVGYTYVDRALSVGRGEIIVRGIRTDRGSYYWVEVGRRGGKAVMAVVAGTPATEAAWTYLVAAASERAGKIGPAFLGNWDIDGSVGVNVVSVGGSRAAPPDDASADWRREHADAMENGLYPWWSPPPRGRPPEGPSGTVLAVSDGLVTISVGSQDGVRIGDYFALNRASAYVGRIKVTKADMHSAAGRFDEENPGSAAPPQPGDKASGD